MSTSWNLLNYPALRQKRRRKHRISSSLAGLLLGLGLAWATVQAMQSALQRWRMQHVQLQAQWNERSQQLQHAKQQAVAIDQQRQQVQQLGWITRQHQAWAALNAALRSQAADVSWRLSRLHMESGKLELSGWSRDFDRLNATRQTLTAHLQGPLSEPGATRPLPGDLVLQTSVANRGVHAQDPAGQLMGVEFVWLSPWPVFKPLNATARPADTAARP